MAKVNYWKRPANAPAHPYVDLEGTPLWLAVKKAVGDLEENQDLVLTEWHQYVVGYICKSISKRKLATSNALSKPQKKRKA